MKPRRARWLLFGACAALVVAAMAHVTSRMLDLESEQSLTAARMRHQERVRLALWRMDTAIAPLIAEEGARPASPATAFAQTIFATAEDWSDDRVRLRFSVRDAAGDVVVRGRDSGDAADVACAELLRGPARRTVASCVVAAAPAVNTFLSNAVNAAYGNGAPETASPANAPPAQVPAPGEWIAAEQKKQAPDPAFDANRDRMARARGGMSKSQRAGQNFQERNGDAAQQGASGVQTMPAPQQETPAAPQSAPASDPGQPVEWTGAPTPQTTQPAPGAFVPVWLPAGGRQHLVLARTTPTADARTPILHGFVLDWARVERSLLDEVSDILPDAHLVPVPTERYATDTTGLVLATLPASLDAPLPAADDLPLTTPTRAGLGVAWLAVVAALAAAGLTLRATVADGERRARFASSVTHELRTPLTTFRLYSEMLADGMVTDPATRQEYLATLKSESARLAGLVENVLTYARVEEGRTPGGDATASVADLVARVSPALRRRCDEAGASLVVRDAAPGATVRAHAASVEQILGNLVDNACKYAASASDRAIDLVVERRGGDVAFIVEDRGPGIAAADVEAAFTPFERANRPPGDVIPGIGLGLALSRGLARAAGGDLIYEAGPESRGARFVATLPAA